MKSTFEKCPGSVIHLQVELTPEEFKAYWQPVWDEALAQVQLKGFRPGQAPPALANQAVNQQEVFDRAVRRAVHFSLELTVRENDWTVIDRPSVAIDADRAGFGYTVDLIILPEVRLGDYQAIARKIFSRVAEREKAIAIPPEEVDKALDWLKQSGADLKNFPDTAAVKKSVSEGLLMEKKEKEWERGRRQALEEIAKQSQLDIPPVLIARMQEQARQTEPNRELTPEQARQRVVQHLLLYRIAQAERLNPTPEEVEERSRRYASSSSGQRVDKEKFYNYIYGILQSEKVFAFLEKA